MYLISNYQFGIFRVKAAAIQTTTKMVRYPHFYVWLGVPDTRPY